MWNSGIFNTGILITRTFLYITEDFWKFEDKAARGKEDDGVDVLAAPAEQHGARRTSAKLKDIAAVMQSLWSVGTGVMTCQCLTPSWFWLGWCELCTQTP